MLNYIWLGLILLAVIIGGCTGNLQGAADKSLDMAKVAVMEVALPLVGIMALWLGMMRLAERAGLVALLARALKPLMCWLFPDVPGDHPAMGSMLMNFAASMLGLNNAATPLGLRAMSHLESLNPTPGTATDAMCMFLAINTSSIQLIPVTAIAILVDFKSTNPTAIVGTALMASACAATSAVLTAKTLSRLPMFRPPAPTRATDQSMAAEPSDEQRKRNAAFRRQQVQTVAAPSPTDTTQEAHPGASAVALAPSEGEREKTASPSADSSPVKESATLQPLKWWGTVILASYALFCVYLFVRLAFPATLGIQPPPEIADKGAFIRVVDAVSRLSIPLLLSLFPLYAALRRVKVYEEFVDGAKEGFQVAIQIIPYLVAILVAVGMFRGAGGIDMLSRALGPLMRSVGFPPDLLPMVLMRPLSGSGSLGIFTELVKHLGPDNLVTRMAGTIFGSSETTFYVLAVYFGSVAIKKTRYAVLAGLTADFVSVVASVIICRLVFG